MRGGLRNPRPNSWGKVAGSKTCTVAGRLCPPGYYDLSPFPNTPSSPFGPFGLAVGLDLTPTTVLPLNIEVMMVMGSYLVGIGNVGSAIGGLVVTWRRA